MVHAPTRRARALPCLVQRKSNTQEGHNLGYAPLAVSERRTQGDPASPREPRKPHSPSTGHEIVTRGANNSRPQWLNRHVVAATEAATALIHADFEITADDIPARRTSARRRRTPTTTTTLFPGRLAVRGRPVWARVVAMTEGPLVHPDERAA